jgi:transposase
MDLSTIARLPVGETPATLFVALQLSKATWLVALHSPTADKISLHRWQAGTRRDCSVWSHASAIRPK